MRDETVRIYAHYNEDLNTMIIRGDTYNGTFFIHLIPSAFSDKSPTYRLLTDIFDLEGELINAQDIAVSPECAPEKK